MSGHHDDHGFAHPVSLKLLFGVFAALIFFTILTVMLAGQDLGAFGIWISMGIATIKATLVALFFMHMYWEKGFNIVMFVGSFLFVSLFIGFTMTDTQAYKPQIDAFPRVVEQAP